MLQDHQEDPYDNAFIECCWLRVKAELFKNWSSDLLSTLIMSYLTAYIECYYNMKRR